MNDSTQSKDEHGDEGAVVFQSGAVAVYKFKVDGVEYLVASRYEGGTAIIKHSK